MTSTRKMGVKQRMLAFLQKQTGYNTFSVAQAAKYFGAANVTATIWRLRKDGYPIYLNTKRRADGSKVGVYRLGTPTKLSQGISLSSVSAR